MAEAETPRDDAIVEIHQSELTEYDLCGERYRRRHIDKDPDAPGTAALRGGGVHGAAQANHEQKIESGIDLPKKDLVEIGVAAFEDKKANEGYRLTPDELSIGERATMARAKDTVAYLTGLYRDRVAPAIRPVLVEEKIVADIPGTKIRLGGRLDFTTTDDRVHDLKTSVRKKSQRDADETIQFTMYDILFQVRTGRRPAGFDLDVLVDAAAPTVQQIRTTRTERDRRVLINRINNLLRARETGTFAPAPIGSWICSPKWCGYWPTCPYVNGDRAAAAYKSD